MHRAGGPPGQVWEALCYTRFKVQGFFICHIIVIQGIIRSEM